MARTQIGIPSALACGPSKATSSRHLVYHFPVASLQADHAVTHPPAVEHTAASMDPMLLAWTGLCTVHRVSCRGYGAAENYPVEAQRGPSPVRPVLRGKNPPGTSYPV